MTLKPVIIDTRYLRPLPKALFKSACSRCDKRQAMWEMGPPSGDEQHVVCSLCFLYESNWGKKRLDDIHELVRAVETETGESFLRTADGQTLASCSDADRILGSIALTSRAFQMHDEATRAAEAGQPTQESPEKN